MKNEYPFYRKLSNQKVFYKITSDLEFEEIQRIGSKLKYFSHLAQQYPEKLKIMDMVLLNDPSYELSSQEEWKEFRIQI